MSSVEEVPIARLAYVKLFFHRLLRKFPGHKPVPVNRKGDLYLPQGVQFMTPHKGRSNVEDSAMIVSLGDYQKGLWLLGSGCQTTSWLLTTYHDIHQ